MDREAELGEWESLLSTGSFNHTELKKQRKLQVTSDRCEILCLLQSHMLEIYL